MQVISVLLTIILFSLLILSAYSDFKMGIIKNKILLVYLLVGLIIDTVYYFFYVNELFVGFVGNVLINVLLSLFLFYIHSFAGGDTKLIIISTILYPAKYYLVYKNSILTLFFVIGLAIFFGYLYLILSSLYYVLIGKYKITKKYVINYIKEFVKNYLFVLVYLCFINLIIILLTNYGFYFDDKYTIIFCFILIWIVNKYKIFKEWYVLSFLLIFIFIFSIRLGVLPFSYSYRSYIFALLLLSIQIVVNNCLYETIRVKDLKSGMILSIDSSLQFQGVRIHNLPKVSTEDLRSRLTDIEIKAINRWSKLNKVKEIRILKKYPFALFVGLGYLSYLLFYILM